MQDDKKQAGAGDDVNSVRIVGTRKTAQRRVSGTSGETHDRAREHINGSGRGCEGRRAVQSRSEEQSKSGRSLITGPSWKESKIVGGLQEILVKHIEKGRSI